jgi:hypothetical protein
MSAPTAFLTRRCAAGQHGLCRGFEAGHSCSCACRHPAAGNVRMAEAIAVLDLPLQARRELLEELGLVDGEQIVADPQSPAGRRLINEQGYAVPLKPATGKPPAPKTGRGRPRKPAAVPPPPPPEPEPAPPAPAADPLPRQRQRRSWAPDELTAAVAALEQAGVDAAGIANVLGVAITTVRRQLRSHRR